MATGSATVTSMAGGARMRPNASSTPNPSTIGSDPPSARDGARRRWMRMPVIVVGGRAVRGLRMLHRGEARSGRDLLEARSARAGAAASADCSGHL